MTKAQGGEVGAWQEQNSSVPLFLCPSAPHGFLWPWGTCVLCLWDSRSVLVPRPLSPGAWERVVASTASSYKMLHCFLKCHAQHEKRFYLFNLNLYSGSVM